jgi:hypothetical protein
VENKDWVTRVAFSFRDLRLFVGFLVILGVRRSSWTDSDDSDDMLPDVWRVKPELCPHLAAGCSGLKLMMPCSTGWSETLFGLNSVLGITFGLYGYIPEDLKPEGALLGVTARIHAFINNFGNWSFPNGLPGCCLLQLSTYSFQYDFRGLKELFSGDSGLWLQCTGRHNKWIPKSSATSSTELPKWLQCPSRITRGLPGNRWLLRWFKN